LRLSAAPLVAVAVALAVTAGAIAGEGDAFLEGLENFRLREPALEIFRPDKEWTFIDVPAQRATAMKERSPTEVERDFGTLHARIWHPDTRAVVSVHVFKTGITTAPDLPRCEAELRADIGRRKGATLVEIGRLLIDGQAAVKVDWTKAVDAAERQAGSREVPDGAGPVTYHYSRVDIPRPKSGATLAIFLEVHKDRYAKVKPGWQKLLKKLKLA
jgi:hypothetical protein